jgi:hypothetical protein
MFVHSLHGIHCNNTMKIIHTSPTKLKQAILLAFLFISTSLMNLVGIQLRIWWRLQANMYQKPSLSV